MKLNIRNKLFLAFTAVLVMTGLVGFIGVNSANTVNNLLNELYLNQTQSISFIKQASIDFYGIRVAIRSAILTSDPTEVETQAQNISDFDTRFRADTAEFEQRIKSEEIRKLFNEMLVNYETYIKGIGDVLRLAREDKDTEASTALQAIQEPGDLAVKAIDEMAQTKDAQGQEAYDSSDEIFAQSRNLIIGIAFGAVVIGLAIAFFLARSLSNAARQMAAVADGISRGELDHTIAVKSKDEMGDMAIAFSRMIDYLQDMANVSNKLAQGDLSMQITPQSTKDVLGNALATAVSSLREVIEDIVQVSQRLAEGDLSIAPQKNYPGELAQIKASLEAALTGLNGTIQQTSNVTIQVVQSVEQVRAVGQDLSANAEEQSSAAEEVTSNLEETEAQVRANADSANLANQLVGETAETANVGQTKMKAVTGAMTAIAQSSQEISKIIKVIDEIAFQTNLLALNAAVEAARAGQHGRGFAVVAQEVRNLAGRSAKAAKETAELIEGSGRQVQEGVGIAEEMAAALGDIVQKVAKVKDLVAEINGASEEQAKGITQINTAMIQVSQGAQANSQQSEELASTADELGSLSDRLREEMARFRLRQQQVYAYGVEEGMRPVKASPQTAPIEPTGGPVPLKAKQTSKSVRGNGRVELKLDQDERGYGQF